MTAIPDGLPSLAQGAHPAGSGRACVMELVSVIAGETWTDHPKCVHPMLACAAIVVNDQLPDHLRHRLLVPHIGRASSGTNTVPDVGQRWRSSGCPVPSTSPRRSSTRHRGRSPRRTCTVSVRS